MDRRLFELLGLWLVNEANDSHFARALGADKRIRYPLPAYAGQRRVLTSHRDKESRPLFFPLAVSRARRGGPALTADLEPANNWGGEGETRYQHEGGYAADERGHLRPCEGGDQA